VKAVLLDALGTLLELRDPAPALVAALREDHGLEVSEAQASRALGAEIGFYRRHNHLASDPERLADLRRRCAEVLAEQLPARASDAPVEALERTLLRSLRFAPYPDARPALERLRDAGLVLVVVSNWDVSLHQVLSQSGLAEVLDGAVTSAEVGADKSSPKLFAAGLRLAGAGAGEAVHVGDSIEDDVAGAGRAGIRSVLLDRARAAPPPDAAGPPPASAAAACPVAVIGSLVELPDALDRMPRT
jgi:putative hydrolase of the HAD superfamily